MDFEIVYSVKCFLFNIDVMHKKQLLAISQGIINSNGINDELFYATLLSDFFTKLTTNTNQPFQKKKLTETCIPGGIALSSAEAAACLNDYLRTVRFIKGTYSAIKTLFNRFPDQEINILYAGCGPYAALLLPILYFFNEDDINVTLLDIDLSSIQSVKELVHILDLREYIHDIIQADAVKYQQPESQPLHMVITETMFHALIREPQVAITANLAPQITKNGILIPEAIKLNLVYTFFGKEPYLQNGPNPPDTLQKKSNTGPKRYKLDTLFSMNKEYNFSDKTIDNSYQFESVFYKLDESFAAHPDICIITDIKIFKNIRLAPSESLITNPYCVASLFNMANHTHFKLIYNFKNIPNWTYQLKG